MCQAMTCLPAIPGFDMTGDKIASAARACIGTPFRPQGRLPGGGLDCIGLAAVAVRAGGTDVELPSDYDLSGDCGSRLVDALEALGLSRASTARTGDVMLFRSGRSQQHLGICTGRGFVHAHLGLRRVVETPFPALWPVLGIWRVKEGG